MNMPLCCVQLFLAILFLFMQAFPARANTGGSSPPPLGSWASDDAFLEQRSKDFRSRYAEYFDAPNNQKLLQEFYDSHFLFSLPIRDSVYYKNLEKLASGDIVNYCAGFEKIPYDFIQAGNPYKCTLILDDAAKTVIKRFSTYDRPDFSEYEDERAWRDGLYSIFEKNGKSLVDALMDIVTESPIGTLERSVAVSYLVDHSLETMNTRLIYNLIIPDLLDRRSALINAVDEAGSLDSTDYCNSLGANAGSAALLVRFQPTWMTKEVHQQWARRVLNRIIDIYLTSASCMSEANYFTFLSSLDTLASSYNLFPDQDESVLNSWHLSISGKLHEHQPGHQITKTYANALFRSGKRDEAVELLRESIRSVEYEWDRVGSIYQIEGLWGYKPTTSPEDVLFELRETYYSFRLLVAEEGYAEKKAELEFNDELDALKEDLLAILDGRGTQDPFKQFEYYLSRLADLRGEGSEAIFWAKISADAGVSFRDGVLKNRREKHLAEKELDSGVMDAMIKSFSTDSVNRLSSLLIKYGRFLEAEQTMRLSDDVEQLVYTRGELPLYDPRRIPLNDLERKASDVLEAKGRGIVAQGGSKAKRQALAKIFASSEGIARGNMEQRFTAAEFAVLLKEGSVLIKYFLFADRLDIHILGARVQKTLSVKIDREELRKLIFKSRAAAAIRSERHREFLGRLYELLFKPVEALLEGQGVKTIIVGLDSELRYVPFSALYGDGRYLVERFSLITMPGAIEFGGQKGELANSFLYGVTKSSEDLQELPGVRREIAAVSGLVSPGVRSKIFLDEAFSKESLSSISGLKEGRVHIASHFILSAESEDKSFLLMGGNRKLSLRELRLSPIDLSGISLVVLSACDSGAESGLEVNSLWRIFKSKGAGAVLAGLWKISDEATPELMRLFYSELLTEGVNPALALQRAQMQFIRSEKFKDPYFWAGFILIGS